MSYSTSQGTSNDESQGISYSTSERYTQNRSRSAENLCGSGHYQNLTQSSSSGHSSSSRPLVSVIIPAYQCADTICQAIDSALAQEEIPLEIVVISDDSPDDLESAMSRYKNVRQVRYCKNKHSLGAAASRNRGVKMAKGRYVAFLDADDWWEKDKLKKQLRLLEPDGAFLDSIDPDGTASKGSARNYDASKGADTNDTSMIEDRPVLCATARELVTPEGELTGRVIPVHESISYRRLLLHNCINCSSVVIRTDVARKFPMTHEDSHEDYITWLRILKKYGNAAAVNEPLLKYRLSSSGKSGSKLQSAKKTYRAYRYAGFGAASSAGLFCLYAVNGVIKYARAFMGGRKQ
ncbi:MAG: glycosyltransferase family 2 protein [Lachnospiraceae bacterium]|nr:glycosyltransferase family 2 protein [Lachnospiraceae bacterium]MCD7956542.1 glycosyltransferase family 2 protein [Lachnospiraceae bacterium]